MTRKEKIFNDEKTQQRKKKLQKIFQENFSTIYLSLRSSLGKIFGNFFSHFLKKISQTQKSPQASRRIPHLEYQGETSKKITFREILT